MTFFEIATLTAACLIAREPALQCVEAPLQPPSIVASYSPIFTGEATDVDLSAQAALVWDEQTGAILYEKNAREKRPIASVIKLASTLAIRQVLQPDQIVTIPAAVTKSQQAGADIRLPIGEQASVHDLLEAALVASANDAVVTLAVAAKSSEEEFVTFANSYIKTIGLTDTHLVDATGLLSDNQFSTAYDVKRMMTLAWRDPLLAPLLSQDGGILVTQEGQQRVYKSTNKLLGTYLPVLAAKTGYTIEAGENLVMITQSTKGQRIGAVILGSTDRFQDMKVLVEWIWRNYTWN